MAVSGEYTKTFTKLSPTPDWLKPLTSVSYYWPASDQLMVVGKDNFFVKNPWVARIYVYESGDNRATLVADDHFKTLKAAQLAAIEEDLDFRFQEFADD